MKITIGGKNPEDFHLQNIIEGTRITKEGINFNIVFAPKSTGSKTVIINIKYTTSDIVLYLSGEGI